MEKEKPRDFDSHRFSVAPMMDWTDGFNSRQHLQVFLSVLGNCLHIYLHRP
jgi:tRNA-dihydrouridine synthase